MLIKSLIWNALLTWTHIPKMKLFRWIETEKMKAKVGIYEDYFGNVNNHIAEIRHDTFRCWQKCCNFHNPTHDITLWVSSKLEQIIAKYAYILLPQIKYDFVLIFLKHFYGWQKTVYISGNKGTFWNFWWPPKVTGYCKKIPPLYVKVN